RRAAARRNRSLCRARRPRQRDDEPECAPAAWGAVHPDLTRHQLNQTLRDGQTEAGSAIPARRRGVCLREGLEQTLARLGSNAKTGVLNLEPDVLHLSVAGIGTCSRPDQHMATEVGELDRAYHP